MEEASKPNSESWKQNLVLAKILLRNYGLLHSFHVQQIEYYTIACCHIAIAGEAEINADSKTVTFRIKTEREYVKNKDKEIVPRHKYSLLRYFAVTPKRYKEECEFAYNNLNTWTKELLWGSDKTIVKVIIDGREITE